MADFSTLASTLHAVQAERDALAARVSAAEQQRADWEKHAEECETRAHNFADDCRAAEARAEAAEQALRVIEPEKLESLAAILDECDRRSVWWFDWTDDEVQRDLRRMASLARAALAGREGTGGGGEG